MKRKHEKTLALLFAHPTSANVKWNDVTALLKDLGATMEEREGSRVKVKLFGEIRVVHRPHKCGPNLDKGAVSDLRDWLADHGVKP